MQRRSTLTLLAVLGLTAALAGCASIDSVSVEVSSQGSWQADRKAGSYAIERLPSQQANAAEQERVEAAAAPAIEAAGFVKAPFEQADYLVQVGARVFEVQRRDPYARSSFYWRSDWWLYRGHRPFFYGPGFYGAGLGYVDDFPDYLRETAILIRDRRSQQIVYETRATQSSRWSSDALLPALFEASMKDFPLPALSPRSVTVALPKPPG